MHYQTINPTTMDITNLTTLGKNIQKWAEENIEISLKNNGCGWIDGGCVVFAFGLKKALDKLHIPCEIVNVAPKKHGDIINHLAIKCKFEAYGLVYMDGDGLATKNDILKKMENETFSLPGTLKIFEFSSISKDVENQPINNDWISVIESSMSVVEIAQSIEYVLIKEKK